MPKLIVDNCEPEKHKHVWLANRNNAIEPSWRCVCGAMRWDQEEPYVAIIRPMACPLPDHLFIVGPHDRDALGRPLYATRCVCGAKHFDYSQMGASTVVGIREYQ